MSDATIALVDRLVERLVVLQPMLREHLADNFGEVLPHMFIGDLTRYVVAREIAAGQVNRDLSAAIQGEIDEVLDALEQAYSDGDEEVEELIAVSFLENLPRDGEPGHAIRSRLGPLLGEQLKRIG